MGLSILLLIDGLSVSWSVCRISRPWLGPLDLAGDGWPQLGLAVFVLWVSRCVLPRKMQYNSAACGRGSVVQTARDQYG